MTEREFTREEVQAMYCELQDILDKVNEVELEDPLATYHAIIDIRTNVTQLLKQYEHEGE